LAAVQCMISSLSCPFSQPWAGNQGVNKLHLVFRKLEFACSLPQEDWIEWVLVFCNSTGVCRRYLDHIWMECKYRLVQFCPCCYGGSFYLGVAFLTFVLCFVSSVIQPIPTNSILFPNLQSQIPNLQFEMPNCAFYPQLDSLYVSSLIILRIIYDHVLELH
jgi:hypothetical protein